VFHYIWQHCVSLYMAALCFTIYGSTVFHYIWQHCVSLYMDLDPDDGRPALRFVFVMGQDVPWQTIESRIP